MIGLVDPDRVDARRQRVAAAVVAVGPRFADRVLRPRPTIITVAVSSDPALVVADRLPGIRSPGRRRVRHLLRRLGEHQAAACRFLVAEGALVGSGRVVRLVGVPLQERQDVGQARRQENHAEHHSPGRAFAQVSRRCSAAGSGRRVSSRRSGRVRSSSSSDSSSARARAGRRGRTRAAVARHLLGVDVQRAEDAQVDRRDRPPPAGGTSAAGASGTTAHAGARRGRAGDEACRPEACDATVARGCATHPARTRAGQPHLRLRRFVHGAAPGGATAPIFGARGRMKAGRQRGVWEPVSREL